MARRRSRDTQVLAPRPPPKSTSHWLILLAGAVLAAAGATAWWLDRPARLGAVIVVSIDTLRADHLPLYGYTRGQTPALDAFGRDAVIFDRAYAHAPQTLPSHASILTGRLPFEHGVRDNLGFTLARGLPTLASLFRAAGYRTGGFVSAYVLRPETGISQGFAVYDAKFAATVDNRSPAEIRRPGSATLAAAVGWLDTLADDHFLLFFHIYEPHAPYTPPARHGALLPYDGEIALADEIVGQLFDALRRHGWYDPATIIVLSDHGEGLGDHGELEHGLFLYDETVHIPLLIKLPRERSRGRRIADPVQHIDLVPTIARLAGLSTPAGLRGRDLGPAMTSGSAIPPQGVYAEALYGRYHFGWSELLSLTDERYRFIKAPRSELYDLDRDPKELTNLIAERTQAASAMLAGLSALVSGRTFDAPAGVSDEDRQRLAALGYIGQSSAPIGAPGQTLPDPKDMAPVLKHYRTAVTLMDSQQFVEAARALKEILTLHPGMTDVWSQYAAVLTRLGRPADALEAYEAMIRTQPNEASGALGAASVLVTLGRLDEARAHAELAVKSAPAAAHQALAQIALARHDDAEALRQADLTQLIDPTLPERPYIEGLIQYNKGHYADALPLLMRAHELSANRPVQTRDLAFLIGDSLAHLDRYAEAEPYLREEIALSPNQTRAQAALAMLYQAMGRNPDAEQAIADMLRTAASPDAYTTAARLWRMFGQPGKAAEVEALGRSKFGGR
jgi:tetratricopeptide (TPR) repeat protein